MGGYGMVFNLLRSKVKMKCVSRVFSSFFIGPTRELCDHCRPMNDWKIEPSAECGFGLSIHIKKMVVAAKNLQHSILLSKTQRLLLSLNFSQYGKRSSTASYEDRVLPSVTAGRVCHHLRNAPSLLLLVIPTKAVQECCSMSSGLANLAKDFADKAFWIAFWNSIRKWWSDHR